MEATALWKATFTTINVTGRNDFVVGPAILIKKDALKTGRKPLPLALTRRGSRTKSKNPNITLTLSPLFAKRGPTTLGCIACFTHSCILKTYWYHGLE